MPAIPLQTLRRRLEELLPLQDNPALFKRGLERLLDQYSDRSYRPGETITVNAISEQWLVPQVVLREVDAFLSTWATQHPQKALELCDLLWQGQTYPLRYMAARLLGALSGTASEAIFARLKRWAEETQVDAQAWRFVLMVGEILQATALTTWLGLIQGWLTSNTSAQQKLALRAMESLVKEHTYENLPVIYQWLTTYMRDPNAVPSHELIALLQALAKRSPAETAYFLRQIRSIVSPTIARRIVRATLPAFPAEYQQHLRDMLKGQGMEHPPS
jgi:hypothetical protein